MRLLHRVADARLLDLADGEPELSTERRSFSPTGSLPRRSQRGPQGEGTTVSLMRDEALSSPDCAEAFLTQGMALALQCGSALRTRRVRHLEVLGRGSSSHAGTVLRYAMAAQGGLAVSASMPSLAAMAHPDQPRGLSKVTETL